MSLPPQTDPIDEAFPALQPDVAGKGQLDKVFPEIEPYNTFYFQVSDLHTLYVEEVGNPFGKPVVFLHGGPGASISAQYRRLFNPALYRIILFDQRGSGKSLPYASLENNTTGDLVADMEKLRTQLDIDQWVVCGGSWGSTLALAYAEAHPQAVSGLILRAIFLGRPEEIRWLYQEGCSWFFPDLWADFIGQVPPERHHELVKAYYELLTHPDESVQMDAAKAWSQWGLSVFKLVPYKKNNANRAYLKKMLALARIECHYYVHNMFFEAENQLLANVDRIRHIPTHIIQGRYDMACPVKSAWDLHQAFPESKLHLVLNGGHAYHEPSILLPLLNSIESMAQS